MDYKLIWRLIYGSFRISGNWKITPTQTQKQAHTHSTQISKNQRSAKAQIGWSCRHDAAVLKDTATDAQQSSQIMISVMMKKIIIAQIPMLPVSQCHGIKQ